MYAVEWRPEDDPLERLVGRLRKDRSWRGTSLGAALASHGLLALAFAMLAVHSPHAPPPAQVTEIVNIDMPPAPAPPVEPPRPSAPPPPERAPARAPQPPAPAQAAAVLTKQADPNEPVDLSDSFVTGSSAAYAGGTTSADGTSAQDVHGLAAPSSAPEAAEAPRPAPGPDRSRKAVMSGSAQWNCSFPAEADRDRIDEAVVGIRIEIDASGAPKAVTVTRDPGHGFGSEAQRCAMGKHWSPALDHEGTPVEGTVSVNVRFER